MIIKEVTLTDVLAAKEKRSSRQQELLKKRSPVVSITINVPGPVKDQPIIRRLCDYAVSQIRDLFEVCEIQQLYLPTGPEALMVVKESSQIIKEAAIAIEEKESFGRLIDIDVFDIDGSLLSRRQQNKSRSCIVCGRETITCMREKRHSNQELLAAVNKLLVDFKAYRTREISPVAKKIGSLACEAMLYEVACTPSPGLVDRNNSGAHNDMDFFSFMASSAALSTHMARTAQAGINHDGAAAKLLPVLRVIGIEAERDMLSATRGINTQKGLLFSLGIAAAAAGQIVRRGEKITAGNVLDLISEITEGIVERELNRSASRPESELTAGEKLYRKYKITGIRGEMEAGLPTVRKLALPALKSALLQGLSHNDALVNTLLYLMTSVDDTTVMNRHNPDKMRCWVVPKAKAALAVGGMATREGREMLEQLDREFISHNVSPGGAADLLAVTWFLYRLECEF